MNLWRTIWCFDIYSMAWLNQAFLHIFHFAYIFVVTFETYILSYFESLSTWSLLGPTFPTFWCHDSDGGSPLILVGPPFQLTPWPPWGRDWPGLILPIALLASNTRQPKSLAPFQVFKSQPFTGHITTVSDRDDGERFHYVQAFSYLCLNPALWLQTLPLYFLFSCADSISL
jgi:hypothetical protein